MKRWCPTWLWVLLAVGLLWLGSAPALAEAPYSVALDEFCGTPQQAVLCPRTTLSGCMCSLNARTRSASSDLLQTLKPLSSLDMPRYRPQLRRLLPEPMLSASLEEFHPRVPTQPPRR